MPIFLLIDRYTHAHTNTIITKPERKNGAHFENKG
jgi:hypothetical protein